MFGLEWTWTMVIKYFWDKKDIFCIGFIFLFAVVDHAFYIWAFSSALYKSFHLATTILCLTYNAEIQHKEPFHCIDNSCSHNNYLYWINNQGFVNSIICPPKLTNFLRFLYFSSSFHGDPFPCAVDPLWFPQRVLESTVACKCLAVLWLWPCLATKYGSNLIG